MSLEELKEFIQQSTTPLKANPQLPTPLNTPLVGKYFNINQIVFLLNMLKNF
jgi:hypothetical protein